MESVYRINAYPAYAKKGDPCVAKAMVVKSGDTNFLCDFVVKDTERGHGIGTRLLEMLIDKFYINCLTVEKDNAIAALNDKVAELQQTITEKDAEIASLGHKAPEQPASQAGQEGKADEKDLSAHNVTHDGMTLKEETEALKARYNQLCGLA